MSHVASYATRIVIAARGEELESDPGWQLLRRSVETVAQEEGGGAVTTSFADFYGVTTQVPLALRCDAFPRGIGVTVGEDGSVRFLADGWGAEETLRRLQARIIDIHLALSVADALRALGYAVEVTEDGGAHGRGIGLRGVLA